MRVGATTPLFHIVPVAEEKLLGVRCVCCRARLRSSALRVPNFIATPRCGSGTLEDYLAMAISGILALDENQAPEPGEYPFD